MGSLRAYLMSEAVGGVVARRGVVCKHQPQVHHGVGGHALAKDEKAIVRK
jgi:hypothetical protein